MPRSYRFNLSFSYGFLMVFLWFSYGFPMVFLWFSYGFLFVFLGFLGFEIPRKQKENKKKTKENKKKTKRKQKENPRKPKKTRRKENHRPSVYYFYFATFASCFSGYARGV